MVVFDGHGVVMNNDRLYYATCWNAEHGDRSKVVALLGPFNTHEEALDSVSEGRDMVWWADPRAPWYSFGTTSIPKDEKQPKVVFPEKEKE